VFYYQEMSRIGKLPIAIPEWVTVKQEGSILTIAGPKGTLQQKVVEWVKIDIQDAEVKVSLVQEECKNFWGLMRSLIANMIEGVTKWYEKKLQVIGVGYSAQAQGQKLTLKLWLSHPVYHTVPDGITVSTEKDPKWNDVIVLQGIDKQLVWEQAAKIKAYRKPEPYKGKWIRYFGEHIALKAGKTAGK